jgi:hypothetical protein
MSQEAPDHSSRPHAEFGPSGLKYVAHCAGFHQPYSTNEYAEKGTRIHEAVEVGDPSALHNEEEVGIYEKIIEAENTMIRLCFGGWEIVEDHREIRLSMKLPREQETFGTCDRLLVYKTPSGSMALMMDYKTGIMKIDPAEENWQAKAYVIGAFQKIPSLSAVTFAFIVPRLDGETVSDPMFHTFTREQLPRLEEEVASVIETATRVRAKWDVDRTDGLAIRSQPEPAELNPSSSCRFCQYEDVCPAMGALVCDVAEAAAPSAKTFRFDPSSREPSEVQKRYLIAKIVEAWAEREKRAAVAMAIEGTEFPDLRLHNGGVTASVADSTSFFNLAQSLGLLAEDLIEMASFPVAKVRDALPKGTRDNFIEACKDNGYIKESAPRWSLKERA